MAHLLCNQANLPYDKNSYAQHKVIDFSHAHCDSKPEDFVGSQSCLIVTDEDDNFYTEWWFHTARNGVEGIHNVSNLIIANVTGDTILGGKKNDFLDLRFSHSSAYGTYNLIGDSNDVFFARCGKVIMVGTNGENKYFININDECLSKNLSKPVIIDEPINSSEIDSLHLCSLIFSHPFSNGSEIFSENGITFKAILNYSHQPQDLAIYYSQDKSEGYEPDVIIRNFCSTEQGNIEFLVDYSGNKFSLSGVNCEDLDPINYIAGF